MRIFNLAKEASLIGQDFQLGGFSGLVFEGRKNGKLHFVTLTDRGPNPDPVEGKRAYPLPELQPQFVWIEADGTSNTYVVTERIPMNTKDGQNMNGLPPAGKTNTKPEVPEIMLVRLQDIKGLETGAYP